jgi:hypothetical protein
VSRWHSKHAARCAHIRAASCAVLLRRLRSLALHSRQRAVRRNGPATNARAILQKAVRQRQQMLQGIARFDPQSSLNHMSVLILLGEGPIGTVLVLALRCRVEAFTLLHDLIPPFPCGLRYTGCSTYLSVLFFVRLFSSFSLAQGSVHF